MLKNYLHQSVSRPQIQQFYPPPPPDPLREDIMNFVSIRIITADIKRLVRFYERITGIAVTMYTEDFGELKTPACTLAIGSTRTLQLFGGGVAARPADNHSAIIEFRVGDVDAE